MKVSQNSLGAYYGDRYIKDYAVSSANANKAVSKFVRGVYCTNKLLTKIKEFANTDGLVDCFNLPQFIVELQEHFYNLLGEEDATSWTPLFLEAINVGADLSSVQPKFQKFVLESVLHNVEDDKFTQQKDAILNSLKVIEAWIETGSVDTAAADAAVDTALYATYAKGTASCAAYAAVYATAYESTANAASAAVYAIDVAFQDSASNDTMMEKVKAQSVELLRLLAECK